MSVMPTIALAGRTPVAPRLRKALAGGFAVALLGATSGQALAHSVCYQVRLVVAAEAVTEVLPLEATPVFRLDVEHHSRLTSFRERRAFDHPIQNTYSAHGKYAQAAVEEEPLELIELNRARSEPVHGTVLVSRAKPENGGGAQMGLTHYALSADPPTIGHIECESEEASSRPDIWSCWALDTTEEGENLIDFILERVNPLDNPSCSTFVLPEIEK